MLSRRGFLLSSAGIITSLFLRRLYAHIEEFEEPLLLTPPIVADTLYISNDEQGLVALGSRNIDQPEQPTLSWLKFAALGGIITKNQAQLDQFLDEWNIKSSDLSKPMDEEAFAGIWGRKLGPTAKAYHILSKLDLGPEFSRSSEQAGRIELIDGGHPGDDSLWVEVQDPLSISLLQARLIELKIPLRVEVTEWE